VACPEPLCGELVEPVKRVVVVLVLVVVACGELVELVEVACPELVEGLVVGVDVLVVVLVGVVVDVEVVVLVVVSVVVAVVVCVVVGVLVLVAGVVVACPELPCGEPVEPVDVACPESIEGSVVVASPIATAADARSASHSPDVVFGSPPEMVRQYGVPVSSS